MFECLYCFTIVLKRVRKVQIPKDLVSTVYRQAELWTNFDVQNVCNCEMKKEGDTGYTKLTGNYNFNFLMTKVR